MFTLDPPAPKRLRLGLTLARFFALIGLLFLMLRLAWVGDDALITLRAALNSSHGWGAGFNVTESVQAYTHPLWFVLWSVIGSISGEWILTIVLVGLVLSLISALLILMTVKSVPAVLGVATLLAFSNAFMEYTTSGLENPMGWVFLGILTLGLSRSCHSQSTAGIRDGVLLGLALAGLMLTRLDLILLIFAMLIFTLWTQRRNLRFLLTGFLATTLPILFWFSWSWANYHSFLPNTFYAKQNLDIPAQEVMVQGIRYLWVSTEFDPVTSAVIIIGSTALFLIGTTFFRAGAIGVLLYLTYVIYIGGDFMAGRFLAAPFYLTVLLVALLVTSNSSRGWIRPTGIQGNRNNMLAVGLVSIAVLGALFVGGRAPISVLLPTEPRWLDQDQANVYDTRSKFMTLEKGVGQWLMSLGEPLQQPTFSSVTDVNSVAPLRDIRAAANAWPDLDSDLMRKAKWPSRDGSFPLLPAEVGITCGLLGSQSILTGPTIHWIDTCALSDRFLAGIPYESNSFQWLVGHYVRDLPQGYAAAVLEGDASLVTDPSEKERLIKLWEQIR
jgi:hypothetical protein